MKLSTKVRAAVLRSLTEGNSVASTVRITGVSEKAVLALLVEAGEACAAYMDKHLVNLPCTEIQLDEIWSFVGCKEKVKKHAKLEHPGDVWTWKGICADTKLIMGWHIGDRSQDSAVAFCQNLSQRFAKRVQISSDGHPAYQWAVGSTFKDCDYGRLVKIYGTDEEGHEVCIDVRKEAVLGNPNMDKISTSYIERANLTLRMHNRRYTRKTNGHSKKVRNHAAMLALGIMAYNYCRSHMTLRRTPAMAANVTDHQWSMEEVVEMMDAHRVATEEAAFEQAFTQSHWTPKRRSYARTPIPKDQIPVPWYLDKNATDPTEKGLTD